MRRTCPQTCPHDELTYHTQAMRLSSVWPINRPTYQFTDVSVGLFVYVSHLFFPFLLFVILQLHLLQACNSNEHELLEP